MHSPPSLTVIEDDEDDDDATLSTLRLGEFFNTSTDLLTGMLSLKYSPPKKH